MGIERSARRLQEAGQVQRIVARTEATRVQRANAREWVRRHLGEDAAADSFSAASAIEIRAITGRLPSPAEVERFAGLWLEDGHRVALGWLLHVTGCRISDHRRFVRWEA